MANLSNTLLDNSSEQLKVVNIIKTCLAENDCSELMVATGYWDIKALSLICKELKDFLHRSDTTVKFLIGTDPVVRAELLKNPIGEGKFPSDYILRDLSSIDVIEEYEESIKLLLDYCKEDEEDSKIKVRLYKTNENGDSQFLHAKCYVFSGDNNYGRGIIGSSNFTQKGLEDNAELNYIEVQTAIIYAMPNNQRANLKGHKYWFDEQWKLATPWNRQFRIEGFTKSKAAKQIVKKRKEQESVITPYEAYIKLLQSKFSYIVDNGLSNEIESYLPKNYKSYSYQIDAVKQCFSIMKEHHGFILGDVVGLGKTIVGTLIIKKFICANELEDSVSDKVLIITPPAIKTAWKNTLRDFDKDSKLKLKDHVDFITTGSIDNLLEDDLSDNDEFDLTDTGDFTETLKSKAYGLIIIDESHKFRNADTQMYQALDNLIRAIGEKGGYPYIGLLSATPQNNRPKDLQNQIYLFERDHTKSTLKDAEGGNLEHFFAKVNRDFSNCINARRKPDQDESSFKKQQQEVLSQISSSIRNDVLQHLLVRRTRTDIKLHYKDVMKEQNLVFPEIKGPIELKYALRGDLPSLFADTVDAIYHRENQNDDNSSKDISQKRLHFYRYRAIEFLKNPSDRVKYEGRKNQDAERFSRQLAQMVQINLIKRLESSFSAFKSSLEKLIQVTRNMITMLEKDTVFICPQINLNEEFDIQAKSEKSNKVYTFEQCCDDVRKKIEKLDKDGRNEKNRNCEYNSSDFTSDYLDGLRSDLLILESLNRRWQRQSADPKLSVFYQYLTPKLFSEKTNPQKKLVIFTESVVTAKAIEDAVKNQVDGSEYKVLSVNASNRNDLEKTIQENFDANYEGEQKDDYQILITTDVLAEGINLHRASSILNYDTPWNATKLMQRIGRVNRIGSKSPFVYVYNFMPSAQGDAEIQLVQKAYTKIQSFHSLFGEDSKIFSLDENIVHYDLNAQVDGGESPQEKYVHELKEYRNNYPERYVYLENKDSGFDISVSEPSSTSIYYVNSSQISGKFVSRAANGDFSLISTLDALKQVREAVVNVKSSLPLSANLNDIKKEVEDYVFNSLNKLNTRANKQIITEAQVIMRGHVIRSKEAKESLDIWTKVDKSLRAGNTDIAKIIVSNFTKYQKELTANNSQLIHVSREDFLRNVESKLSKLVNRNNDKKLSLNVLVSLGK